MRVSNIQLTDVNKQQYYKKKNHFSQEINQVENKANRVSVLHTQYRLNKTFIPYFAGSTHSLSTSRHYEEPGDFKVCNVENLTCPCCGKPMLTKHQYENIKAQLKITPESQYIDFLSTYVPYMTKIEANVFSELKDLSEAEPTLTFQELITELRNKKLSDLEAIQIEKLESMRKIADEKMTLQKEKTALIHMIDESETVIAERDKKQPFQKKVFIEKLYKIRFKDYDIKKELLEIAKSFPSSVKNEAAWIVKYGGLDKNRQPRKPEDIAGKFLLGSVSNTDHILAQDQHMRGEDIIENYMAMHASCNSAKANKSFMEWFNEDPKERENNIRKYLKEVQVAIDSEKIDRKKYRTYTKGVVETIRRLSNGILNFKIKEKPRTKNPRSEDDPRLLKVAVPTDSM